MRWPPELGHRPGNRRELAEEGVSLEGHIYPNIGPRTTLKVRGLRRCSSACQGAALAETPVLFGHTLVTAVCVVTQPGKSGDFGRLRLPAQPL